MNTVPPGETVHDSAQAPLMLVATPGGHILELAELAKRLPDRPVVWVTARNAQTESLLAGQQVAYVPPVRSRELGRALASWPKALDLVRRHRPSMVISTGAALAVPYLLAARTMRVPVHYIESATRRHGTSVTARLISGVPGVRLYHQGLLNPGRRWTHVGSAVDAYQAVTAPQRHSRPVRRVLVTLGGERFPFPRLVDLVATQLPADAEVVWQLGSTPRRGELPGRVHDWLSFEQMRQEVERADVVITHAGVGSVLTALDCGRLPVVLARRKQLGEHVDDHQAEWLSVVVEHGLARDLAGGAVGEAVRQAHVHDVHRHPTPPLQFS